MSKIEIHTSILALSAMTVLLFQNCSSNFAGMDLASSSEISLDASKFSVDKKDPQISQLSTRCPEATYAKFNCLDKVLTTAEGLSYKVTFRWNRVDQDSVGTVIWVLGGQGTGKWRTYPQAGPIQDDLADNNQIRSVEIDFNDPAGAKGDGGYWVHGGGYYSAALAYMEAVGYVTANLKTGQFMNHVGGSNGTTVPAFALSHFDAGKYVDRFIFHAGPFLPSLTDACNNNHFASFSKSPAMYGTIMSFLGSWAFKNSAQNVCQSNVSSRLSVLDGAKKSYPNNGIHVVMGDKERTEGFGPWIIESNLQWYSQVEAAEKTRKVSASIGHEMEWSSIKAYASLNKPQPMGAAPVLTFSLSQDGAASSQVPVDSMVYGKLTNIDSQSAMACMTDGPLSDCENPHKWVAFPNPDWSFSGGVWRSAFIPAQSGLPVGKTYQGFNINTRTGQRSAPIRISIVEAVNNEPKVQAPPLMVFSVVEGGASVTRVGLNQVVYGIAKNLPQYGTKACMQEVSQFYLCDDPKNWSSLPNGDWSYVGGQWKARFIPQAIGGLAGKTYKGFQVNTLTGERTPTVTLTVAP